MATGRLQPRFAELRLVEALTDTPVVLIHGPRQAGKTTLAAALADPAGFIADLPERVILDEVQRVPALFPAIKS